MLVAQIVEYEDYDNTTDYYHVNEYEYEEEYDDRYGPAEREGDYTLNAQVPSNLNLGNQLCMNEFCVVTRN